MHHIPPRKLHLHPQGQDIKVHNELMPLDTNGNCFPHLVTTKLDTIAHHNAQLLSGLGCKIEEMGQAILNEVVGTSPVDEDDNFVTMDRTSYV